MNRSTLLTLLACFALFAMGCGAAAPMRPTMAPLAIATPAAPPAELTENHFTRDKIGTISEDQMREILSAPVYLEAGARIGIVPVVERYEVDETIPLTMVTGALARDLGDGGLFEVVSEVSTDWPSTQSIAGLRELATRYRAEYLLLYRHRFIDRSRTNAWGFAYLTVVGALFVPSQTLESAGVLEATLFDVKTGTLLFTVFERVNAEADENVWHNEHKVRKMKEKLLAGAARGLSGQVQDKLRSLVAARPVKKTAPAAVAVAQ
ncbi:MAG: hypothetical protein KC620_02670 [Myxococcales bacterium]|nr:hypothetical protein [Myxococcales bacterium]